MADYKELDSLIGKLKRSAIDAYMHSESFSIEGDRYVARVTAVGHFTEHVVSRPGEDGEGGGSGTPHDFTKDFDAIRKRIDKAITPWKGLPDPETIAVEVEECRVITRDLSGAADASNGTATGSGDIVPNIDMMRGNLDSMSGGMITAFKQKFLGKLDPAVSGLHAISLVHGAAIAGEQGIFEETRRAVAEAVDSARAACDAIVQSGGGNLEVTLKIAEWAAKGAGVFAAGGSSAAIGIGLTELGLEVVETVTSDEAFTKAASGYSAALTAFQEALNKINDEVTRGEQAIRDNLVQNLNQIRTDTSSYDLTLDAISSSEDITIISPGPIEEIFKSYMPAIAAGLETVATNTLAVTLSPAVNRDGAIGIGATGPNTEFAELNWLLYELLKDLSWEVTTGAKNLELAVNEIMGTDADVQAGLDDITAEVNAGSGVDPWD